MKKFLFIPITLLMLFVIVACNRNTMTQEEFDLAIDGVSLSVNVSGDFDLPKLENIKVTWTSDHDAIKFADGKATVTQGAENILVNITATFEAGSLKDIKTYEVIVTGIFNEAINSLSLKNEYYPNEQIFIVTQHKDVTITWSSTSNLVNEIDDSIGVIFLNSPIQDTSITLTATFKRGELVLSKDYEILIKADVAVDVQVSITFVVGLADGVTANDVYLVGDFNGWTTTDANYKLIKDGDKFTGTFTFTATAGEIFSYKYYSHDWELGDNRSINIVDGVTSITRDNDVIAGWDSGNIVTEEFTVDVTFNVTLPNNTPKNDDIFIVGNFNLFGEYPEWDPKGNDSLKLTRNGNSASITLTLDVKTSSTLLFKYTRGGDGWVDVEKSLSGDEIDNRTIVLTSEQLIVTQSDTVARWADLEAPGNPVGPEIELNVEFIVTLPQWTPEDDDIYLVGNFNLYGEYPEWDGIKMNRDGLTATITLVLNVLENQQLEYKIHRGTWDEVEGNELGEFLPNRTTTLTSQTTEVEFVVAGWEDIEKPVDPETTFEVLFTLNITLPEDFAGPLYLLGDFTNWDNSDEANLLTVLEGNTTFTTTLTVSNGQQLKYKFYSLTWENIEGNHIHIATEDLEVTIDVEVLGFVEVDPVDPDPVTVETTFNVTLPEWTPEDDDIFLVGNFGDFGNYPNWIPASGEFTLIKLERIGLVATVTLELTIGSTDELLYKFIRGSWDKVESQANQNDIDNRTLTLTSETTTVNVEVLGWIDIKEPAPVVDVASEAELVLALADEIVTEINLTADITLTEKIVIFKNDLTINGHGKKITLASETGWQGDYIIQVYLANNVLIKDLELVGGDAAILVNGGQLTIENLKLTNQEFGGIEVSQGLNVEALPELTVTGTLYNDLVDLPVIWIDGKTTNDDWVIQNLLDEVEYTEAGKTQLWFTSSIPNEEREVTLTFLPNFPETTPEGTIYLLGTFNDWQKNDDYQLVLVDEVLTLVITVNAKGGDTFEYKYFFEGETPLNFENGNDRVITIGELDEMLLEDTITAWEGIHRIFFIDNTDWNLETISIHIWGVNAIDHTSWDQPLNFIKDDAGFFYYDLRVKDFYSYDYGFIIRDSGGQSDDLKYHPNLNLFTLTGAANNRWIIEVSVFLNY